MTTSAFLRRSALAATLSLACLQPAFSQSPSLEDLWTLVQEQQARIAALEARLAAQGTDIERTGSSLAAAEVAIDATASAIESLQGNLTPARNTNIHGYGELHYSRFDAEDHARDGAAIDFHRFVLQIDHRFSDRARFVSELELEHSLSGDGAPGEMELEQAYVQFDLSDQLNVKTGLFLVPVGILNETHEPPTFYGVERNSVENVILPSTWWEAGGMLSKTFASGLSLDVALHSGLAMPATGANAFRVRSGRQKVAEALAEDLAATARVRYTGRPGLELAASLQYQADASQAGGDGIDSGQLLSAHADYRRGGFGLRALFARWDFAGDAVTAAGVDVQRGWYIEPGFRFGGAAGRWGVYGRLEQVRGARLQDMFDQTEFGMNFWPLDDVTLKVSYRDREHRDALMRPRDFRAIDLGFGYQF